MSAAFVLEPEPEVAIAAAAGGSGGDGGGDGGGLVMSEQLRQAIRLLQLSRLELIAEIRKEMNARES